MANHEGHHPSEGFRSQAHSETRENYLDVHDVRLQQKLIERFFSTQHPGIPLSDHDARACAAHEWIGDPNDTETPAARFRQYIDTVSGADSVIDKDDTEALDRILATVASHRRIDGVIHNEQI